MHELVVNLHMHTTYSDGNASHAEIAKAAQRAGIDAVIITDHNVWVNGPEGYWGSLSIKGEKPVLLLVGEEIHDQARDPQKNHLLVFGAGRELAHLATDPQHLIEGVKQAGGLSFLAHPIDPPAPAFNQDDLSWVDWDVRGYTGIELWNAMTEFKSLLRDKPRAIFYAYNPAQVAHGPFPQTLALWDELLSRGHRVVAIGGSDAHAFPSSLGPFRRVLFPYEFHFKCVNTHVVTPNPLSGDALKDRRLVLDALRQGHAFIGYDLPASTKDFRFTAHCKANISWMGDRVSAKDGVTLQIKLPQPTECRLLKDGEVIKTMYKRQTYVHSNPQPGVYRVEAYIRYRGRRRGWIFSNPIYVK